MSDTDVKKNLDEILLKEISKITSQIAKLTDKNSVNLDEEKIFEEIVKLKAEYDTKQYQRDRKYPEITEQLDMIYWDKKNGTKKWEEFIDKVKLDNPKPE